MIYIRDGKTPNPDRDLVMTEKTQQVLAGGLKSRAGRKQRVAVDQKTGLEHFELYCFRHTFLTVLGASGGGRTPSAKSPGMGYQNGHSSRPPSDERISTS